MTDTKFAQHIVDKYGYRPALRTLGDTRDFLSCRFYDTADLSVLYFARFIDCLMDEITYLKENNYDKSREAQTNL